MRIRCLTVLILSALALCSCNNKTQKNAGALPFVETVLSNHDSRDFKLLSSSAKANPQNELFVIGSHSAAWSLANLLCESDKFDNINGSAQPDRLPDFAGEYFCIIADSLGRDFNYYIDNGQTDTLRELCTRYCLSAIDTISHLSIYDEKGLGIKKPAKVIIIADPVLSAYCKYDVDTLFSASGCKIKTVSPIDFAFREICASYGSPVNIGVICTPDNANSAMYQRILDRYAPAGSKVAAISVAQKNDGALQEFLSAYRDTIDCPALNALIVDDRTVSLQSLEKNLGEIRSLMFEDSKTYGDLIGNDFKIVSTDDACSVELFHLMRTDDLFTHDIRLPKVVEYITVPVSDSDKPYMLISTNVQN